MTPPRALAAVALVALLAGCGVTRPEPSPQGSPALPSDAFSATQLSWDFFSHHPKS